MKKTIPVIQVEKHSTKIHTFCCINWKVKSDLRIYIDYVPKKRGIGLKRKHLSMDSESTISSFSDYMLPFLHETEMENGFVLMDGARCHTSEETICWLDENNIQYIPFGGLPSQTLDGYPPNSPDLNPIENVFSYWQTQVSNEMLKITELIKFVKEEWDHIPLYVIQNCIKRLPKVMEYVYEHNGEYYNP